LICSIERSRQYKIRQQKMSQHQPVWPYFSPFSNHILYYQCFGVWVSAERTSIDCFCVLWKSKFRVEFQEKSHSQTRLAIRIRESTGFFLIRLY
jgi:hypothetical protein